MRRIAVRQNFLRLWVRSGSDVRACRHSVTRHRGGTPCLRSDTAKRQADIVNFGYVLNVIEDPAERVETLVDAFRHARRLLVVSGLINETVDTSRARRFGDGVLTQSNTFQKYYEHRSFSSTLRTRLKRRRCPSTRQTLSLPVPVLTPAPPPKIIQQIPVLFVKGSPKASRPAQAEAGADLRPINGSPAPGRKKVLLVCWVTKYIKHPQRAHRLRSQPKETGV